MAELASDAILLERFAKGREEAAFVVLVKRHGPLVERICRRILRNEQDVEDVFQATFLILARKAAFISWQDSVSGWLTAVAHRLAMHARSGAARQRVQEISISALAGKANDIDGRLPEKYHPLSDPSPEIERRDLAGSSMMSSRTCRRNIGRPSCCATSRAGPTKRPPSNSAGRRARCPGGWIGHGPC